MEDRFLLNVNFFWFVSRNIIILLMNSCYRVYAYNVAGNISTHANYITGVGGFCPPPPPFLTILTRKLNNLKTVQAMTTKLSFDSHVLQNLHF